MACDVVVRELAGDVAPGRAVLLVCDDAEPFALVGEWAGATAIVGSEPVRTWTGADPLAAFDEQPQVQQFVRPRPGLILHKL